ncbi:MAG: class I SAM-dependent methyltransferase [Nocardioides sp.]
MSVDLPETSFSDVFARALQGHPCTVVGLGDEPVHLPMAEWSREADDGDHEALLAHCVGTTLDVGCGPGRLVARLAELGHVVLGIDVVAEAVQQTRDRGVPALVRDVFERVPGEGRWQSVLLADGNIGIGGDPVALLTRLRELLDPRGRIVVELGLPGLGLRSAWAALQCGCARSRPFRWSTVGVDAIEEVAARAGLVVAATHRHGERWTAVLEEPA